MCGGARKVWNARWDAESNEERDKRLPRYVTRARDVTGPVTRAPCAPGHVFCHALALPLFPSSLSFSSLQRLHPFS